jgi:hypothetical protein
MEYSLQQHIESNGKFQVKISKDFGLMLSEWWSK